MITLEDIHQQEKARAGQRFANTGNGRVYWIERITEQSYFMGSRDMNHFYIGRSELSLMRHFILLRGE